MIRGRVHPCAMRRARRGANIEAPIPAHAPVFMPDVNPPPPSDRPDSETPAAPKPDASLLQVIGAVFWSFFGVRKGNAMRRDMVTMKPHQVIIVGILIGVLFVATLLFIVRLIIAGAH